MPNLHLVFVFKTQCSRQSPIEANLTFNPFIDLNSLLTLTSNFHLSVTNYEVSSSIYQKILPSLMLPSDKQCD